jgi:hypothetical protein
MQRMLKENFLSERISTPSCRNFSQVKNRRQNDRERIFIRAIALVNQDIALANYIYNSALEKA